MSLDCSSSALVNGEGMEGQHMTPLTYNTRPSESTFASSHESSTFSGTQMSVGTNK
jgi:hypothetical protein